MKLSDINIRDPYILLHDGVYYLYGTRSATCWGPADGFDCYTSKDLKDWSGPVEIFHRPEGFFADRNYWAPECVFHDGTFYFFATLGAADRKKGVYLLTSHSPLGPFVPAGDTPLTPAEWTCIDGSLYWEDGVPYLLFSHSFEDEPRGDMCAVELSADLTRAVSGPMLLFSAADAPWASPVPFAKAEFGMEGDVFFTDGPCAHRMEDGSLGVLWASWSPRAYAVGMAVSQSGTLAGPWEHRAQPVFPENGGHGMLFRSKEGELIYTLHYPNDKGLERPILTRLSEADGAIVLNEKEEMYHE